MARPLEASFLGASEMATDAIVALMAEHRRIEGVLDWLDLLADRGATRTQLRDATKFLRGYADAYHHAKEEDVLFRAMVDEGMSEDEPPIVLMLEQHGEARRLVGDLAEIAEAGAGELSEDEQRRFARVAGDYVALLRTHIREEDEVVYPIARARIRPAAWDEVERECAEIDAERRDEVAALLGIAERLSGTSR